MHPEDLIDAEDEFSAEETLRDLCGERPAPPKKRTKRTTKQAQLDPEPVKDK